MTPHHALRSSELAHHARPTARAGTPRLAVTRRPPTRCAQHRCTIADRSRAPLLNAACMPWPGGRSLPYMCPCCARQHRLVAERTGPRADAARGAQALCSATGPCRRAAQGLTGGGRRPPGRGIRAHADAARAAQAPVFRALYSEKRVVAEERARASTTRRSAASRRRSRARRWATTTAGPSSATRPTWTRWCGGPRVRPRPAAPCLASSPRPCDQLAQCGVKPPSLVRQSSVMELHRRACACMSWSGSPA